MKIYIYILVLLSTILAACDDGRIYEKEIVIPQEGLTLKLTGELTGATSWPDKYSLVIAGFSDGSDYATLSKVITSNIASDGSIDISLSGIKENIDEVELCIINRLRKRIVTFTLIEKADFPAEDTIRMDVGTLNVGMYESIQNNIFSEMCASCHGANGSAARGLFLTEDRSYNCLVNQHSKVNEEMLLVDPGNASDSFLPLILEEDGHVAHSHIDILDAKKKTTLLTLIKDWINNGAKQ